MPQRLLCVPRLRQVPQQCSWVEQRLVREGPLEPLRHAACPLSLCLVTVAEAPGLRFSAERSLCQRVSMPPAGFCQARQGLIEGAWVASQRPLSQVLALDRDAMRPAAERPTRPDHDEPVDLKAVCETIWAVVGCAMLTASASAHISRRPKG
jgi:hypothetical protein